MPHRTLNRDNLYNIAHWGEGYFTVNQQGNIEVSKNAESRGVELQAIVNAASRAGLQLPLLIRFTDILRDRVLKINEAFNEAIEENNYRGHYKLVYPIKVNQESSVARELLKAKHPIGLEAGSKPELMAVIGLLGETPSTIVCNGYKDRSYVRTALIAQQMGHEVFIVVEKRSELDIILKESARLEIKPKIGVRIRLVTKGAGKWENTGGAKSKFGLNAEQVLDLVKCLKTHNSLDCLQLMHCHLGSQIANIHDIRHCMQEVARYYVELRSLQAPITTVDVGGGLGVDYEGTHSTTDCSINYSIKEYATNILLALRPLCEEANMPEPNIISESGRALTAHHAVLVTNITDVELIKQSRELPSIEPEESHVLRDILDTYQSMSENSANEIYNYATLALDEAHSMFKHGVLSLEEKAKVEKFFTAICFGIQQQLDDNNPGDSELLKQINERMAAKIFCNLSFFQSLPDAWAIGQIFPVAPISHLTEMPKMHSILQDLTCDSDGTIKEYTGSDSINTTLLLPAFDTENPYALAFFLVGAYQEILGNLHNLFGDTNSLDVKLLGDGQFEITDLISGDTVTNVLNYAHFDTKRLLLSYEKQLIHADLSTDQIQIYLNELRSIFSQLTYLGSNK
ncbi:biosynthetic arginine decarboxylase [Legionella jordanis]|uniref:Arginine decarboxylase n=1 Tax=Legionella jordanis TaxID=456 RepID=A0A0W0V9A3_9GAMM|nr:biosynthetic arginine decarboxylase [Legionella jordanis]KTD16674.1 arginine decarboxylase [Legionella jordanis]RMX03793.1 biosynthetic arginine decarboxylase [Legionella jordanis]RMX22146.1 biosynthetic arginine decarboxylase [Legionella jordanis]VEH11858.1 arginine decarboxylase [Legionella jordanis]HAT8712834.1 biosynthetic arginine decarboxylase [Legionella jordanis]